MILAGWVVAGMAATATAEAADRRVPSQYPTIQAGIDAAVDGDTVLVADGTYTGAGNRDIDFAGKAITLRSENGYGSTIIDCQSLGIGFRFHSAETRATVVEGFTVTGGYAQVQDSRYPTTRYGGVVWCVHASPTIRNNRFVDNYALHNGGAIYLSGSSALIGGNVFVGNDAGAWGSALYALCYPNNAEGILDGLHVARNEFTGNGSGADDYENDYTVWLGGPGPILFEKNSVSENPSGGIRVDQYAFANWGDRPGVLLRENMIVGNSVPSSGGSAVWVSGQQNPYDPMDFPACEITNTLVVGAGSSASTGISISSSGDVRLTNVTLSGFSTGILMESEPPGGDEIARCVIRNSIVWGNAVSLAGVYSHVGFVSVSHSAIPALPAEWDAGGNVWADPLFADGEYRLAAGSPCIDAADGNWAPPADREGNPRYDDPAVPNTGSGTPDYADLGASERWVNTPPVAHAGPDQTVAAGSAVTLNGAGSTDPDNLPSPLTYTWTGPLALSNPSSATPSFAVPMSSSDATYTFSLQVSDGAATSAPDTVNVTALARSHTITAVHGCTNAWFNLYRNQRAVVRNGTAGAVAAATLKVYLSRDAMLDASDVLADTRAIPALAAGASAMVGYWVRIPADWVGTQVYALSVVERSGGVRVSDNVGSRRMGMTNNRYDVNGDGGVNALDISAVVDGFKYASTPASVLWNSSLDVAPLYGNINVIDISGTVDAFKGVRPAEPVRDDPPPGGGDAGGGVGGAE